MSHRKKVRLRSKKTLIIKISIFSLLMLGTIFGIVFTPRNILNYDSTYSFAVSKSYINDEKTDLVLYDYDVFPTKEKFEEARQNYIPNAIKKAKEENKIIVIKLPSEVKSRYNFDNYILMYDPLVPELNIEYYTVQNIYLFNKTLPTLTTLTYYRDIEPKINLGFYVSLVSLFAILLITFLSFDIENIIALVRKNKLIL